MEELNHPVVLFDGVCNLCNSSVQFLIRHDRKRVFRYAALQSGFGKMVIEKFNLTGKNIDSIMLYQNNAVRIKSDAALHVVKQLGGLYPVLYIFIVVPRFIRDAVYDLVARNRYRWFGKQESCMIPDPELKKLFIET